jgi:hypothetical protein
MPQIQCQRKLAEERPGDKVIRAENAKGKA